VNHANVLCCGASLCTSVVIFRAFLDVHFNAQALAAESTCENQPEVSLSDRCERECTENSLYYSNTIVEFLML
jgi:hypothetical protein